MKALDLFQAERIRQITLGYSAAHDSCHSHGELARAALARLLVAEYAGERIGLLDVDLLVKFIAPWSAGTELYRESKVKLLTEAGALLAAELERLLPPPSADTALDDRAHSVVAEAIGVFSRATGNVGRIADPIKRRHVLELLRDYAEHLTNQVQAELEHTTQPKPAQEQNHAS